MLTAPLISFPVFDNRGALHHGTQQQRRRGWLGARTSGRSHNTSCHTKNGRQLSPDLGKLSSESRRDERDTMQLWFLQLRKRLTNVSHQIFSNTLVTILEQRLLVGTRPTENHTPRPLNIHIQPASLFRHWRISEPVRRKRTLTHRWCEIVQFLQLEPTRQVIGIRIGSIFLSSTESTAQKPAITISGRSRNR